MNSEQYVLLVEDDLDISESIQTILEEEKYKVECTFNGKEALEYLATAEVPPSLILLDIMMPYMNGYEFREAQLKNPKIADIPTVILSAGTEQQDIDKLHFTQFIKKPLDLDTLIDVLKNNILH